MSRAGSEFKIPDSRFKTQKPRFSVRNDEKTQT